MVERIIYRRKKDIADAIASYIWPDGQFEKGFPEKATGITARAILLSAGQRAMCLPWLIRMRMASNS